VIAILEIKTQIRHLKFPSGGLRFVTPGKKTTCCFDTSFKGNPDIEFDAFFSESMFRQSGATIGLPGLIH
jgi:hypothetical protein